MLEELIKTGENKEVKPKGYADKVPVFCCYDEIVPTEKLTPNPKNPNTHPESQIKLLEKIIESQGWRSPITVSTRSGYIVKGHGRLQAAQEGGFAHVPVDYQDYASEAEEMADLTADNRLSELSSMDDEKLYDVLVDIQDSDIDTLLSGYSDMDIEVLLNHLNPEDNPEEPEKDRGGTSEPLCKAGDVWELGENRFIVSDSQFEELKAVDDAIRGYILHTGNLLCTCVRDDKRLDYMDLIREWAVDNEMEEILDKKIPVVKNRE